MTVKNQYPVVLLHGMFGFGQQQVTNSFLPYFGLWKWNVKKHFNKMGIHTVAPSMGPFTSAWDRACEIYAQLVGGTVDYGKAHSEKYGHERYGRTYEALLPEWGTVDKDLNRVKINIIGHSFGGVSGRMLTELMVHGSEEERLATDPEDLSPLFKGGHEDWVHSITTLASPHNGMTSVEGNVGKAMGQICRVICDVMAIVDTTKLRNFYDLELDMFHITTDPEKKTHIWKGFKDRQVKKFLFKNKDNIVYDLTLQGAAEVNEKLPMIDNVYYFSHRVCRTKGFLGKQYPTPLAFPLLNILGFFMGRQPKKLMPGKKKIWRKNDMVINTESAKAPLGYPARELTKADKHVKFKPGKWYVYPEARGDHMSYCGWLVRRKKYKKFYMSLYETVSNCK